ncbi:MAG: HupE/UreJ family protein [Cyanobacteria bacterium P01_F01_bin.143]
MLQKKMRAIAFICASLPIMSFIVGINPAQAHHPLGGGTPANFIEGLLSGFGHPIIGLDYFAFVIAFGLIAVLTAKRGLLLPILVSAIAFYFGKLTVNQIAKPSNLYLRFAGFTISGIGLTFLSNAILS